MDNYGHTSLSELSNDPMVILLFNFWKKNNLFWNINLISTSQIPFHSSFHDTELMDTGLSSDSDCNSYSGLLELNLHSSSLERDLSKFDSSNFPNLLSGIGMFPGCFVF